MLALKPWPFLKNIFAASVFAGAILSTVPAVAMIECNPMSTDRPDAAETSEVVCHTHFQLETSFFYTHNKTTGVTDQTYSFPTLLRYGLLEYLELRLETEIVSIQTQTGSQTETGLNDLAIGTKLHLFDSENWIPSFGTLVHLSLPIGQSPFSSEAFEPTFKTLADWKLPLNFSLGTNAGMDIPVQDSQGDKYTRFLYAVAVGHPLSFVSDDWGVFVEWAGAVPLKSNKLTEQTLDTGLTWGLSDSIQLDTVVQIGITRPTPDVAVGLGFSWRI